jgi:hypothetical protein
MKRHAFIVAAIAASVTLPQQLFAADGETPEREQRIHIHTGVFLLNPYTIDPNTRLLNPAGETDASASLQVDYQYVWAFSKQRQAENKVPDGSGWRPQGVSYPFFGADSVIDIEARIGYVFQSTDEPSASTIIGSGEFLTEVTVGSPIYRYIDKGEQPHSVSLDVSYGMVTDRATFDVHHRIFGGFSYRTAFHMGDSPSQLTVRFGGAGIEVVDFANDTTTEVVFERGAPKYSMNAAWALEAEARIPIVESLSAVLGTRIYGGTDPNLWTAYLGATIPIENFGNIFK